MTAYLEVLSNLTNKTLEGELADEELGRLLVPTNFTESDGTRAETMRLLDTTSGSGGGGLTSLRLSSELLTGGLAWKTDIPQSRVIVDNARAKKPRNRYLPPVDLRAVCC